MGEELKPCPLCGSPAEHAGFAAYAHCSSYDCAMHYVVARNGEWNDRPERTCKVFAESFAEEDAGIWTTECGWKCQLDHGRPLDHWRFCPNCGARLEEA